MATTASFAVDFPDVATRRVVVVISSISSANGRNRRTSRPRLEAGGEEDMPPAIAAVLRISMTADGRIDDDHRLTVNTI
ncbi:hypothetical protein EJB05_24707, partial [Eragrostis curvula]